MFPVNLRSLSTALPPFGLFKSRIDQLLATKSSSLAHNILEHEMPSHQILLKVLSQAANQRESLKSIKRQVIQLFARRPNDTGSPEVQIGLESLRMCVLEEHVKSNRHDHKCKRALDQIVHQRRRMLKYLRRMSLERFYTVLDRLGLKPNYLDKFDNPYLFKFKKPVRERKESANRTIRGGGRFLSDIAKSI